MVPSRTGFLCALSLWCVLCTKCSHLLAETFIKLGSNSRKMKIRSSTNMLILKPKSIFLAELSEHFGLRRIYFLLKRKKINFYCWYQKIEI